MGFAIADRAILTSDLDQHQVALYVMAQTKSKCNILEGTRVDVSGDALDRRPTIHNLVTFLLKIPASSARGPSSVPLALAASAICRALEHDAVSLSTEYPRPVKAK